MKLKNLTLKITFVLGITIAFPINAFRDVSPNSKLQPALTYFIEKNAITDHGFFRAQEDIPALMFWQILLTDAGFNEKSADFQTPLPPNIDKLNPLAPYLKEAIRRDFIDQKVPFNEFSSIKRIDALELLLKTKGIRIPTKTSKSFKKLTSGVSPLASYLPIIEAAYASGFINKYDLQNIHAHHNISRRDFVLWTYNWHQNGEKRISSLDTPKKQTPATYPYQKRVKNNAKIGPKVNVQSLNLTDALKKQGNNNHQDLAVLNAIYEEIQNKYKFSEKLDEKLKEKMIDAAILAMVNELGDKYSTYIGPEKSQKFMSGLNGNFEGIGAYVEMIDNNFTITSPIKGSPAETAGIMAGDIVKKINDEDITGMNIRDIINKIKGPSGSTVQLFILRKNNGQNITVTRGKITIPSITIKWNKSIPIIGIHQFNRSTGQNLTKIINEEILPKSPKGIVFDLRNNPGGFLTSAVSVGSIFLEKDQKIFSVEYKNGDRKYSATRTGELANYNRPMVFLQNKGTASASEILTAMIQDYKIGMIMGTNSLGKGTVQEILSYKNGANFKLTIAKWLSPQKRWINETGVIPDKALAKITDEQKKNKQDPQLDAAINQVLHN